MEQRQQEEGPLLDDSFEWDDGEAFRELMSKLSELQKAKPKVENRRSEEQLCVLSDEEEGDDDHEDSDI